MSKDPKGDLEFSKEELTALEQSLENRSRVTSPGRPRKRTHKRGLRVPADIVPRRKKPSGEGRPPSSKTLPLVGSMPPPPVSSATPTLPPVSTGAAAPASAVAATNPVTGPTPLATAEELADEEVSEDLEDVPPLHPSLPPPSPISSEARLRRATEMSPPPGSDEDQRSVPPPPIPRDAAEEPEEAPTERRAAPPWRSPADMDTEEIPDEVWQRAVQVAVGPPPPEAIPELEDAVSEERVETQETSPEEEEGDTVRIPSEIVQRAVQVALESTSAPSAAGAKDFDLDGPTGPGASQALEELSARASSGQIIAGEETEEAERANRVAILLSALRSPSDRRGAAAGAAAEEAPAPPPSDGGAARPGSTPVVETSPADAAHAPPPLPPLPVAPFPPATDLHPAPPRPVEPEELSTEELEEVPPGEGSEPEAQVEEVAGPPPIPETPASPFETEPVPSAVVRVPVAAPVIDDEGIMTSAPPEPPPAPEITPEPAPPPVPPAAAAETAPAPPATLAVPVTGSMPPAPLTGPALPPGNAAPLISPAVTGPLPVPPHAPPLASPAMTGPLPAPAHPAPIVPAMTGPPPGPAMTGPLPAFAHPAPIVPAMTGPPPGPAMTGPLPAPAHPAPIAPAMTGPLLGPVPPPPPSAAAQVAKRAEVGEEIAPHPPETGELPAQARGRKRKKAWFEEIFDEDWLRTLQPATSDQLRKQVDFLEESLQPSAESQLLDLGCGEGRHTIELASRGYHVTGYDLSLPLLIRAADEAQRRSIQVNFIHGDFRELAFQEQFDAVYTLFTSFGYFDDDSNRKMIHAVASSLRVGGRFLLDVINRDYAIRDLPARIWWEGQGCVVLEEVDFNYFTSRMISKRSVVFEDGRHLEQEISVRAYSLHELGKILHHAGFRVLEVTGHMAHRTRFFGNCSRSLVLLAEKRAH